MYNKQELVNFINENKIVRTVSLDVELLDYPEFTHDGQLLTVCEDGSQGHFANWFFDQHFDHNNITYFDMLLILTKINNL